MKHPSIDKLALYAGGELPVWTRWMMRRHVDSCAQCQTEIALFGEAAREARAEVEEMPAGVHWDRMAAEMRANIRLGVEASEAISSYSHAADKAHGPVLSWRLTAVAAGLILLASVGYWVGAVRKSEQLAVLRGPDPVVLEASERGVGMSDGVKGMELHGPSSNQRAAFVTVSTEGAAGAQYVDEETGQITVNQVYVE